MTNRPVVGVRRVSGEWWPVVGVVTTVGPRQKTPDLNYTSGVSWFGPLPTIGQEVVAVDAAFACDPVRAIPEVVDRILARAGVAENADAAASGDPNPGRTRSVD